MNILELDDGTYIHDRLAYRVEHEHINAWGYHCLTGTLFDLVTMTIQRNANAACNMPTTRLDIVANAFRKALHE